RGRCRVPRARRRGPDPRLSGCRGAAGPLREPRALRAPREARRPLPHAGPRRGPATSRVRRPAPTGPAGSPPPLRRAPPREPHGDDPALAILRRVADDVLGLFGRRPPEDVGCQAHLDTVQFPRLLRSVAVAAEDLVPVDAPRYALGGREDRLEVHGTVRSGL